MAPGRLAYARERGLEVAVVEAAVDAAAAQADVDGALAGTTAFTALNVGGTNVRPFLDRTDGSMITNSAALDTAVVPTVKIAANAVTDQASAETAGSQTLTGTTPKEIQTVTYTATGQPIEVRANFFMTVWHPAAGDISANVVVTRDGLGTELFNQLIVAIGGDYIQGWQTPIIIDTPAAGSVTYRVTVTLTNNAAATQTVQGAFLSVREFKR